MNRKDLEEIYYLNREAQIWEQRLAEIREKSPIGSPSLDGMPRAAGTGDKVASAAIEAKSVEEIISGLLARIQMKRAEVMEFIGSVEDSQMRQILKYRCINNMPWWQVAEELGGGNTENGVRKKYYRFMDKYFPKK